MIQQFSVKSSVLSFFFRDGSFIGSMFRFLEELEDTNLLHGGERGRDGGVVAGNDS